MDKAAPSSARWHHTIPSHGPATVFMTTGNKPTPALQYPSLGSLVTRLMPAATRACRRTSASATCATARPALAGYLGTGYNPFIVEGAGAGDRARPADRRQRCASAASRCPTASRSKSSRTATACCEASTAASRPSTSQADLVDGLDAFHQQALEILRSDKTSKAFDLTARSRGDPRALRHNAVRPGRARRPPAGRGRRALRHHQPRRLGHARPELQRPTRPACCRSSTRRCRP